MNFKKKCGRMKLNRKFFCEVMNGIDHLTLNDVTKLKSAKSVQIRKSAIKKEPVVRKQRVKP